MSRLTLYGDLVSGNCLKTRWTADRLGLDYDWIDIDVVAGGARTDEFLAINPAGQVPCAVLADGRLLAQSNAIILHLAELAASDLLPTDPYDRAKMFEWLFWEQYSHEPYIAVRRFQKKFLNKADAEMEPKLLAGGRRALGLMERTLLAGDYFVGEALSLADISLVAYTRLAHEGGFDLDEFPQVREWVFRVERELDIEHALALEIA